MKKLAVLAVCALATSAHAATIVQSDSAAGVPDFDHTFTFDRFDGALGTLNSVDITLTLDIDGGFLEVDNDAASAATANVEFGANGSLSSVDVNVFPVPTVVTSNSAIFNLSADDLDGAGVQTTGADYGQLLGVATSNSNVQSINAAFLGDYVGAGTTYDLLADINQVIDFGGVSGIAGAFDPQSADVTVRVVYNYTPVPAPGALALVGLGGFVAARRRR